MEMFTEQTIRRVNELAELYVDFLIPFPLTTALIFRGEDKEHKYDRIDTKLIKQAEKLNKKEKLLVKIENRGKIRQGAVTYKSYSIKYKKDLIASIRQQVHKSGQPLSKIIRNRARILGIHPKNITRWYHTKQLKKKQGGRRALYPEMEIRLANFIISNPKMKRKHILRQAKQIMEDLQIPGRNEFNFSKGWYERFRERLSKKKVTRGVKLEDMLKLEAKQQGYVKQEEDQFLKDNQQFEEYDYSEDDEDEEQNVKFQENLSDNEDKENDFFNVKLDDLSNEGSQESTQVKQELFFESEQEQNMVKQEEQSSTERTIKIPKDQLMANNSKIIDQ